MIEEDMCVIKFGFYQAHFAVYQTETSGDDEFCEDLPDTGKTIFVLNYMHDGLKEVPVDFRIITDFTGLGRFAKWKDIEKADDISRYTVHYHVPTIESQGSLTTDYTFMEAGDYIGIVTAKHPSKDKIYRAVFPFQVGSSGSGYFLFFAFILVIVAVQIRFRTISYIITWLRAQLAK